MYDLEGLLEHELQTKRRQTKRRQTERRETEQRETEWLMLMRSDTGGWGATLRLVG